ncbi:MULTISPECIES: hypothetical protein [Arthrobacter]|uniref:Uncharacterized protein n=1 Tax=Arthrobacter terricola TaxID=2547396 RepID=A0A4R5K7J5_9MICC|nr:MULTISPECIES: hypothetical protein [Arthrobacter]MBT8163810.1 hypothetical protein [Arthrobacter sp. GN70]TDF86885.1 hypothetical protein E1809_25360 [Arthrobacter terricola]
MTTSQNRQPKRIAIGGQLAPETHAEATLLLDPAHDTVTIAPGDSDNFAELAGVIEALNVARYG